MSALSLRPGMGFVFPRREPDMTLSESIVSFVLLRFLPADESDNFYRSPPEWEVLYKDVSGRIDVGELSLDNIFKWLAESRLERIG